MLRKKLDKIVNPKKMADGGDPGPGKPKKRLILAETPTSTVFQTYFEPIDKKYSLGTFSSRQMQEGREELFNAIVKFADPNSNVPKEYEDVHPLADLVFDMQNNSRPYAEAVRRVKEVYKIDISKIDSIKKAYGKATGYPGIVKYGIDNFQTVEEVITERDDTFLIEAEKAKKASLAEGVPAEIIELYGKEGMDNFKKKYPKSALKSTDVVMMGHSSSERMFGVPNDEINEYFGANMDPNNDFYCATCNGPNVALSLPNIPNLVINTGDPWVGVPDYKNYKGKGNFTEILFGNKAYEQNDDAFLSKTIKPNYGEDYFNTTKNPELLKPHMNRFIDNRYRNRHIDNITTNFPYRTPPQKSPYAPARMEDGGDPSKSGYVVTESLRKRMYGIVKHEKKQGGIRGNELKNAGIGPEDAKKWLEKKYGKGSKQSQSYISDDDAVDYIIENYLPKVKGLNTEDEIIAALDMQFNAGKDARVFAYQEWLRTQDPDNTTGWMDESGKWAKRNNLPPNFDDLYNKSLGKLKDEERLDWLDKGRNWYYKNIWDDNNPAGVGYWNKTQVKEPGKDYYKHVDKNGNVWYYERGKDGSLSPGYGKTWSGRLDYTKPEKDNTTSTTSQPQIQQTITSPQAQQLTPQTPKNTISGINDETGGVDWSGSTIVKSMGLKTGAIDWSGAVIAPSSGLKFITAGPTGKSIRGDSLYDFYDKGDGTYVRKHRRTGESVNLDYGSYLRNLVEDGVLTWKEVEDLEKNKKNGGTIKQMPDGGYGGPFFGPTEGLLSSLFSGMQGSGLFNPQQGYTGSWQDNSKAIEQSIYGEDKTKYGVSDFAGVAQAWAKETGQSFSGNPGKMFDSYSKSLQDRAGQKFDTTNSNATNFNAMLPVGMQLAQLFDLQQRENDEIQNKKLNIGDFSVKRSSYAPAGFSFNGGLISKYKQKPMAILRNGGGLFNNLPVGNYDQEVSGYVPLDSLIPIQTEVGELIILPTGDVTKTNATKRHSRMKDDEVTDVVPENSYILSKFGSVNIYKKDADQIIIEAENKPYNIYSQNQQPKVKTLGDIMTSKKMKPADLATIVINKFKLIDNQDPFTVQTNAANKMTRAKYLQAIIGLSEYDKERQGINNDINVQMQELNPEMFAKDGGRVMRANYDVPKAVAPLLLAAIPSIISGIASLFSGIAARNARKKAFNQGNNYINQFQTEGNQNIQGQLGSELFGFAMQDPNVKLARKSTDYLDAAYAGVPNQNFLAQQNALMAGEQDLSQLTPQQAVLFAGQMYANRADSMNKYRSQMNLYNSDLAVKKNLMLNDITNFNLNQTANERNLTQQGRNQNFAGIASSLSGYYNNKTNMAANILNARQANLGQSTATFLANNQNNSQNVLNTAALALQGYNSYLGQTSPQPGGGAPQGGGFGGGSGANFNNNGYNYFFPQYGGTGFNVMNAPTYQMKLGPQ